MRVGGGGGGGGGGIYEMNHNACEHKFELFKLSLSCKWT